jgi:predicted dehydrogenase
MNFADVRRMLWDQEDRNRPGWWRQKRRHGVLGYMRELKIHAWDVMHGYCEAAQKAAA